MNCVYCNRGSIESLSKCLRTFRLRLGAHLALEKLRIVLTLLSLTFLLLKRTTTIGGSVTLRARRDELQVDHAAARFPFTMGTRRTCSPYNSNHMPIGSVASALTALARACT